MVLFVGLVGSRILRDQRPLGLLIFLVPPRLVPGDDLQFLGMRGEAVGDPEDFILRTSFCGTLANSAI